MRLLVTNMGDRKKPWWYDIPVEVLIEQERKKQEQLEQQREQLRVPAYSPSPRENPNSDKSPTEEEHKLVIKFI